MKNCLNCGTALTTGYCPECGQAAATARLTLREAALHAADNLFSLDAALPRTFVGLWRNPGRVAREYVAGKRVPYVAPLRYCLTAIALLVLVHALMGPPRSYINFTDSELSPALQELRTDVSAFTLRHLNLIILAALPLQALVLRGLFRRTGFNYAEVLGFTLYVMGQTFLVGAVLVAVLHQHPALQLGIRSLFQTVYLVVAAVGFFGEGRPVTILKGLVASVVSTLIVAAIVVLLAVPRIAATVREAGIPGTNGSVTAEI